MMPSRAYLVCCVPRTGSSLLAQALAGTGVAGRPREYFNPSDQDKSWMREILGDSSVVDGLPKILIAGTTPNGWFGAKVHASHFRHLGVRISTGEWKDSGRGSLLRLPNPLLDPAAYELLQSECSRSYATAFAFLRSGLPDLRVIWLKRKNMVARAISEFRARQSWVWMVPAEGGTVPSGQVHDFDLAEIHSLYRLGGFHEELLQQLFEEHEISPYTVMYEELAADYESTVHRVLGFLGVDGEQAVIPPPCTRKQSDALSEEWEERYRKLSVGAGI